MAGPEPSRLRAMRARSKPHDCSDYTMANPRCVEPAAHQSSLLFHGAEPAELKLSVLRSTNCGIMRAASPAWRGACTMNFIHRRLCRSARWNGVLKQFVLPWVLDGVDLGGNVLEVGP